VTMRIKDVFLPCAIIVVGLLVATPAVAQAPSGSCDAGGWLVQAFGPTPVDCGTTGGCTEITYEVSSGPTPDHVAAVVASGSKDCSTPSIVTVTGQSVTGNQSYNPGAGDPITGLGKYSCHDEAAKVNPNANVSSFTIRVLGTRGAAPKSVVVKKGGKTAACEIVGIGEESGAVAPVVETLRHEGCAVDFTLDQVSGAVLKATLNEASSTKPLCQSGDNPSTCCSLLSADVSELNITLGGQPLGDGQFGDGYIQSGSASCTTRIIGGRVYTWGSPCPE